MNNSTGWGTHLASLDDLVVRGSAGFNASRLPVVCFSHLRWGFVWQRPQHLLTRISRQRPVYFVEEPLPAEGDGASCLRETVNDGVIVLTPVLSAAEFSGWGFNTGNNPAVRDLLADWFETRLPGSGVIAWYYTPMAIGALPHNVEPEAIIFDAMDELSKFRGAPTALIDNEQQLMRTADLVFAGGPSLYEARKRRHHSVHCFPSGVEAAHFGADGLACPEDIAHIKGPVIGFYGVIDERIDLDLVAGIADLRPDWTILMIGPLAKIEESDLPRRANIHYPGMRTYDQLPAYLARFDAAILPFAINDATRFISPTKTLEYLSGGKPVVSTPIRDVIDLYGNVVEIASNAEEFVQAITFLWSESARLKQSRARMVKQILQEHDWDYIASQMMDLLDGVLQQPASTGFAAATASIPRRIPTAAIRGEVAD